MKVILILLIFASAKNKEIKNITGTCYQAVKNQCDDSPLLTANQKKINEQDPLSHRWIAVSRDLKEFYAFGDTIVVSGTKNAIYDGKWVVQDLMNVRWKNKIDFLVGKNDYIDKFENLTIKK